MHRVGTGIYADAVPSESFKKPKNKIGGTNLVLVIKQPKIIRDSIPKYFLLSDVRLRIELSELICGKGIVTNMVITRDIEAPLEHLKGGLHDKGWLKARIN